jgi:prephenate dehydratase
MLEGLCAGGIPKNRLAQPDVRLANVRLIHTLGPRGTNCEMAAHHWFRSRGIHGEVILHTTLEDAVLHLKDGDRAALLGCAVYPDLHTLVFSNMNWLELADSFVIPTYNMLLASRGDEQPSRIASHPAPQCLVPEGAEVVLVTSNSLAAKECAEGNVDGCITTLPAAEQYGLKILEDFGPVPMDFTIHVPR